MGNLDVCPESGPTEIPEWGPVERPSETADAMNAVTIPSCGETRENPGSGLAGCVVTARQPAPMDSFGAWSAWFHGGEPVKSIGAPLPFPEESAGAGVRLCSKEVREEVAAPLSGVGAQRSASRTGVKRVAARACALPQVVRGQLPQASPARRTKVARLRSFDDWSNWFWRRDWPESEV